MSTKEPVVLDDFRGVSLLNIHSEPLHFPAQAQSFSPCISQDENDIDLLTMSSPNLFTEALVAAGKGARFAKEDTQDSYKLIPNPIEQWNLYGFEWLGK